MGRQTDWYQGFDEGILQKCIEGGISKVNVRTPAACVSTSPAFTQRSPVLIDFCEIDKQRCQSDMEVNSERGRLSDGLDGRSDTWHGDRGPEVDPNVRKSEQGTSAIGFGFLPGKPQ